MTWPNHKILSFTTNHKMFYYDHICVYVFQFKLLQEYLEQHNKNDIQILWHFDYTFYKHDFLWQFYYNRPSMCNLFELLMCSDKNTLLKLTKFIKLAFNRRNALISRWNILVIVISSSSLLNVYVCGNICIISMIDFCVCIYVYFSRV